MLLCRDGKVFENKNVAVEGSQNEDVGAVINGSFQDPTTIRALWWGARWWTVAVSRLQWGRGLRVPQLYQPPSLNVFN